nr:cadherin-like beta sandwich domain-containing protein [Acidimicrobiia bacterium]
MRTRFGPRNLRPVVLVAALIAGVVVPVATHAGVLAPVGAQSGVPSNLVVQQRGSGELAVSWELASGTSRPALRYRVSDTDLSQSGNQEGTWIEVGNPGASGERLAGLVDGVEYDIAVSALDDSSDAATGWASTTGIPRPAQPVEDAAELSALALFTSTDGTTFSTSNLLNPGFDSDLINYYAVVAPTVSHIKIQPTTAAAAATLTGTLYAEATSRSEEISLVSGQQSAAIALDYGDNRIDVVAVGEDGGAQVYILTVQRPPVAPVVGATPGAFEGSPSANLTHDAPPTGFAVHFRVKPDSEEWDADVQAQDVFGEGVFEAYAEGVSIGAPFEARTVVPTGFEANTAYDVTANLFLVGRLFKLWHGGVVASDEVEFTTWDVPGVPTGLAAQAVASDTSKLNVSWQAPAQTGGTGATVSGYKLRWRQQDENPDQEGNQEGFWLNEEGEEGQSVASTTHEITGLKAQTTYEVQVRAVNGIDPGSDWSASATATTSSLKPPEGFKVAAGSQRLTVTWAEADPVYVDTFGDGFARWRVKDTDPNTAGDNPGPWLPTDPRSVSFGNTEYLEKRLTVPLQTGCEGCDPLTNGTPYEVELKFRYWDNDWVETEWISVGEGTPTSLQPTTLTLAANSGVDEGDGTLSVFATLDEPAITDLEVTLKAGAATTATAATDYTLPGAFTIPQGRTFASADVGIVDNAVDGTDKTLVLTTVVDGLTVTDARVTIRDDDTAGVTVSGGAVSLEHTRTADYTVVLDSEPTATVTVAAASSAGAATVSPATLTFTTANWQTPQTITLSGQSPGTATVAHTATSADTKYSTTASLSIDPKDVTVTATASLSALSAESSTDGTSFGNELALTPSFTGDTTAYAATVAHSFTHVRLTPTAADPAATVEAGISGTTLAEFSSGAASDAIALPVGDTAIEVRVTAQDQSTKTYTVTVTRKGQVELVSVAPGDSSFTATWRMTADVESPTLRWRISDIDSGTAGTQPGDWTERRFLQSPTTTRHVVSGLVNGISYDVAARAEVKDTGPPRTHSAWSPIETVEP